MVAGTVIGDKGSRIKGFGHFLLSNLEKNSLLNSKNRDFVQFYWILPIKTPAIIVFKGISLLSIKQGN
jgi:hypothetical protein